MFLTHFHSLTCSFRVAWGATAWIIYDFQMVEWCTWFGNTPFQDSVMLKRWDPVMEQLKHFKVVNNPCSSTSGKWKLQARVWKVWGNLHRSLPASHCSRSLSLSSGSPLSFFPSPPPIPFSLSIYLSAPLSLLSLSLSLYIYIYIFAFHVQSI